MPRTRPPTGGRKAVYWWTTEIAELRSANQVARRRYTNTRRKDPRRVPEGLLPELRAAHAAARKELRGEIARAKARSADEFVATLNQDPWGRPYRAVSIKLGPWAPPSHRGPGSPVPHRGIVDALSPSPCSGGGRRRRDRGSMVDPGRRYVGRPRGQRRGARFLDHAHASEERGSRSGRSARACMGLRPERPRRRAQAAVYGRLEVRDFPPGVEGGDAGPAAQARQTRRVALVVPADMPVGRGGQALGAYHCCPPPRPPRSRGPGSLRPPIRL